MGIRRPYPVSLENDEVRFSVPIGIRDAEARIFPGRFDEVGLTSEEWACGL